MRRTYGTAYCEQRHSCGKKVLWIWSDTGERILWTEYSGQGVIIAYHTAIGH